MRQNEFIKVVMMFHQIVLMFRAGGAYWLEQPVRTEKPCGIQ